MKWKMVAIPESLDTRVEALKEALGERSKWAVILRALEELEKKIEDKRAIYISRVKGLYDSLDIDPPQPALALHTLLFNILTDPELTRKEAERIIIAMIEEGRKRLDEVKRKRKAEEEAEELFKNIESWKMEVIE